MRLAARESVNATGNRNFAHLAATRSEGIHCGSGKAIFLQQGGAAEVAEVRNIDRLLG
jgi:hypothetical protein